MIGFVKRFWQRVTAKIKMLEEGDIMAWTRKSIVYTFINSTLGTPYYYGGDDKVEGYDCSGLVMEIMQAIGVLGEKSDMSSRGLYNAFRQKYESKQKVRYGDLVFYGRGKINHVAFALGSKFIFEAGGGRSTTKTKKQAAKINAFVRIRPIDNRKDLVAILNTSKLFGGK